jgi:hypothetical protein
MIDRGKKMVDLLIFLHTSPGIFTQSVPPISVNSARQTLPTHNTFTGHPRLDKPTRGKKGLPRSTQSPQRIKKGFSVISVSSVVKKELKQQSFRSKPGIT